MSNKEVLISCSAFSTQIPKRVLFSPLKLIEYLHSLVEYIRNNIDNVLLEPMPNIYKHRDLNIYNLPTGRYNRLVIS